MVVEPVEELCHGVETVKAFCYLGDRANASEECELAVTERVKAGRNDGQNLENVVSCEKEVSIENKRANLSKLHETSNVVWKRSKMFER